MANVQGTRSTGDYGTGRRKYDHSDKLWLVDPDFAVLAFLTRKLSKRATTDPEYRWFDKESPTRYDAVNYGTGYTAGATSVVVDTGTLFRAGDVVKVLGTGEQMLVTAVSTNTLTVSRGWGSTAAGTLADDASVVIIGNANEEGAAIRTSLSSQATKRTNYTQIFREPIDETGTATATEVYAGPQSIAQLRREHLQIHMRDIERSFFFGEPKEDTSGTEPRRATGGAEYFISTNVTTESEVTETEFEGWIKDIFAKGGDKKMGFASPLVASAINSWAVGKLQMYPKDKTYGIAISKYLSVHGELDFVVEKLFNENSTWNGMCFALDMSRLSYRYLAGNGVNRDTKLLKDRQTAGTDSVKDEYLSEVGFELATEAWHGLLDGVTSYA